MSEKKAVCRGCGMVLNGNPYHMGGTARHPDTNELCSISYWGGFVCSNQCDDATDTRQKASIDTHRK